MNRLTELTLRHFKSVVVKDHIDTDLALISNINVILPIDAMVHKESIVKYFEKNMLSVTQLNQSFYKSWKTIGNISTFERYVHQILHYASTYGTNFTGEMYIPSQELELPEDVRFFVIQTLTARELITKCNSMLASGIAMKQSTITDILEIYKLLQVEPDINIVKNKEAICIISTTLNIMPTDPVEMLRVLLYKTTDKTMLIKDRETINAISFSNQSLKHVLKQEHLISLATIFNRFKPLFLAFKRINEDNAKIINRISKLSKVYHKPMKTAVLNTVTSKLLTSADVDSIKKNATVPQIVKALNAVFLYGNPTTDVTRLYKVRNGRSYIKANRVGLESINTAFQNYTKLKDILKEKVVPTTVFIPKNIEYGLPLSEKHFLDNIPFGTQFYGDDLTVGIYWKNGSQRTDLDISATSIAGKVGWNSSYMDDTQRLRYSGDITDAPNGAVEYLQAGKDIGDWAIKLNVFRGDDETKYKLLLADSVNVNRNYMMDPANITFEVDCVTKDEQTTLGLITKYAGRHCFVVTNLASGTTTVSTEDASTADAIKATIFNSLSLNDLLEELGYTMVDTPDKAEIDLSLSTLTKDKLFALLA